MTFTLLGSHEREHLLTRKARVHTVCRNSFMTNRQNRCGSEDASEPRCGSARQAACFRRTYHNGDTDYYSTMQRKLEYRRRQTRNRDSEKDHRHGPQLLNNDGQQRWLYYELCISHDDADTVTETGKLFLLDLGSDGSGIYGRLCRLLLGRRHGLPTPPIHPLEP